MTIASATCRRRNGSPSGWLGDKEPDLVRIERDTPPMSREIWLMVHPELRELTRIRAVMDWLEKLSARL
jgi:hypothetical protein